MTASMKILVASLTLVATGAAYADCAADLATFEAQAAASADGIAKDGSLAPLQGDSAADTAAGTTAAGTTTAADTDTAATTSADTTAGATGADDAADGNQIAKDGSTAPLETTSGASSDVAMSGQDAQAQQEGQATAAEQAAGESGTDARATALQEARAALEAGDEAACQEALKRAAAS